MSQSIDALIAEAQDRFREGRPGPARKTCRRILDLDPDNADALHMLGILDLQRGAMISGVDFIRRAIGAEGNNSIYHNSLAGALGSLGDFDEAVEHYAMAVGINPEYAEAWYNFANIERLRGNKEEAAEKFRRAVEAAPEFADAYNNLGTQLMELGRIDEAEKAYRQGVAAHGDDVGLLNNMAALAKVRGYFEESADIYRRITELAPGDAAGWRNLAAALKNLGLLGEALSSCLKAMEIEPNEPATLDVLGDIRLAEGRVDDALETFDKALGLAPDFAFARSHRGMVRLLKGDFGTGWEDYQWRLKTGVVAALPGPLWDGSALDGRTILLTAEQGFGDTLQFARYAPLVAALGGRVVVQCQPQLERLFASLEGADEIVPADREPPGHDCHAPLISLPHLFATTLETIPADVPYLRPDDTLSEAWEVRLGDGRELKVGLVWRGNPEQAVNRARSCPPELLAPLARVPGVSLFGLQKDAADMPQGVTDLGGELSDFADTAAAMSRLDLVISICTATAHLAGALGRPLWIPLAFAADWRWLQDRDDSPWYPTARLFRQRSPDDWEGVVARLARALEDLAP